MIITREQSAGFIMFDDNINCTYATIVTFSIISERLTFRIISRKVDSSSVFPYRAVETNGK